MLKLERQKVVLQPTGQGVGSRARFNPGTVREGNTIHMLFRAVNGDISQKDTYISEIGYARLDLSGNLQQVAETPLLSPSLPQEVRGCEDPRIVWFEDRYCIFYTAYDGVTARVAIATTRDFAHVEKLGVIGLPVWDKDAFIFPERVAGKIAYLHRIEPNIQLLFVESLSELLDTGGPAWQGHLRNLAADTVMRPVFTWEAKKIGAGAPPIATPDGWVLIYHGVDQNLVYRAGAALLDRENPRRVLARLPYPILEPEEAFEREGDVPNVVFPEGLVVVGETLQVYYGAADKVIGLATVELPELIAELKKHRI